MNIIPPTTRIFEIRGLTLAELRGNYGMGLSLLCNGKDWLGEEFAHKSLAAGQYEISFVRNQAQSFSEQIKGLSEGFEPIGPAILAEIIFSHYEETRERLCEEWWSRTNFTNRRESRLCLGKFGSGELQFCFCEDNQALSDLSLLSMKKL